MRSGARMGPIHVLIMCADLGKVASCMQIRFNAGMRFGGIKWFTIWGRSTDIDCSGE